MLKRCHNLRDLHFRMLMDVYAQSNRDVGSEASSVMIAEQDFYQYLQQCFFKTPGAVYAIWEENGMYLSALRLEPYRDGLLLEALETHPDYRRKGYASLLIRAVQAHLPGETIYAHVHKRNIASLAVHAACGFQKERDYAVYIDGSVLNSNVTLRWKK